MNAESPHPAEAPVAPRAGLVGPLLLLLAAFAVATTTLASRGAFVVSGTPRDLADLALSALAVALPLLTLHQAAAENRLRFYLGVAVLLGLQLVLLRFVVVTGTRLDCLLVLEFGAEVLEPEAQRTWLRGFEPWHLGLVAAGIAVGGLWFLRSRPAAPGAAASRGGPRRELWLLPLAYLVLVVTPWKSYDNVTHALKSVVYHFVLDPARSATLPAEAYPLVSPHPGGPDAPVTARERPHVFVILVESLVGLTVEARLPDGRELTPFLNRKLREGLYVKRFYGNATQTVRGEVATLCGVIPAYGLSIFRGHPQLGLRCLPSVFSDLGYRTIFLEGYRGMDAFGVGPFWRGHGFQQVEACPAEVLTPAEREHVWGWGLQDDHLYRRFFRRLDDLRAQAAAPEEVRFFGTLMPISNHFFFDQLPAEQRALHPEPTGLEQHFQNSIHAVDGYLAAFFEAMEERPWLANSLVVILGDHGINLGRDQFGYAGAAEANFRVPLLVLWPGKLAPRYLEGSASQLDVAPTLLDLLGIETAHQFQGRSLLDPARPEPTVPLVSSFQARTLAAVRHPWKLVVETEPWREFLFHLEEDPGQTTNRVAELGETGVEQELRGTIARIIQSQALVLADRVYPGDRKETAP